VEGAILFLGLIAFIYFLLRRAKKNVDLDVVDETLAQVSYFKIFIWLIIGGTALYFGSDWLVSGAIAIAEKIGVSEAVISVSMIAFGTSVPELAASVIAVVKKERAISLGNLIGSNIFNIGSVLGLTSMIKTIPVTDSQILTRDIFWMLLFAAVILPMIFIPKRFQFGKLEGIMLVGGYGLFIFLVFLGSN
ncbi:MAG: sodium:calcium antiporter, partial [Bacteroidia bacterium]|nr:sodium:calcium antiporter [Bacteroidia bacterium]